MSTATENAPAPAQEKPKEQLPALRGPRLPYHPLIEQRFGVDRASWKALVEAIFPLAQTTESVVLALSYCKARKLDPFKRNVHIVPIYNHQLGGMVDTIWPGIGELRTTAFRTGDYAGRGETEFGPDLTQKVGTVEMTFPEWARVTVYRMVRGVRCEFVGPKVYWLETYATKKRNDDTPNEMWRDRPRGQIDKCFDSETEVLTDQGFQPFGFVTGRILQVTDSGIEPTDAVPFSQKYDGEMIVCDGNSLNFSVTPNHDMLTTAGKVEAHEVFSKATSSGGHGIPLTLESSQTKSDAPYTDKQLTLAAAIVCDGYRKAQGFAIAVSREEKVSELEALSLHSSRHLRKSAGDTAYAGEREIVTRSDKAVFGYARQAAGELLNDAGEFEDAPLLTLSRRQARLMVDALMRFDGSATRTARRFYSSNQRILGAFELLACIAGYSVSRRRERQSDIGGPNWNITVSTKEQARVFRASRSQSRLKGGLVQRPNDDGYVWCCRVPSGVIVVRRHGLSMLCGNCGEAASLRAAFPEEIGGDYIPEEVQRGSAQVIDAKQSLADLAARLEGPADEGPPGPPHVTPEVPEIGGEDSPEITEETEPQLTVAQQLDKHFEGFTTRKTINDRFEQLQPEPDLPGTELDLIAAKDRALAKLK